MIKISEFNNICLDIRTAVPGIEDHLLVAHEEHAVNKLKDKIGVILLGIIPSADREGQANEGIDTNATWFFVLEKAPVDQDDTSEIEQYGKTQEIVLAVREYIEEAFADGDIRFRRYRPGNTKVDPEYREFGGWNGWSMSVVF